MQTESDSELILIHGFGKKADAFGPLALARGDEERKALLAIIHDSARIAVPLEVFQAALDPISTKMVLVNDLTEKVTAYRREKFTIKANLPKLVPLLAGSVIAISSTSLGFLGFMGLGMALWKVLTDTGINLTTDEAIVFGAVFDNRNENLVVPEADLLRFCTAIAESNGQKALSEENVTAAVNQLSEIGVFSIHDGNISLADPWVFHGKWR